MYFPIRKNVTIQTTIYKSDTLLFNEFKIGILAYNSVRRVYTILIDAYSFAD